MTAYPITLPFCNLTVEPAYHKLPAVTVKKLQKIKQYLHKETGLNTYSDYGIFGHKSYKR